MRSIALVMMLSGLVVFCAARRTYSLPPDHPVVPGMLSVKSFGATGDGRTDDTAAIERAIRTARERGQAVFFPDGQYRVRRPLVIERQRLIGALAGGWCADSTPMPRILVDHTRRPALTMKDGAAIHGLAFMYDRSGRARTYAPTILLAGNGLSITNVRIQYPQDGIIADGKTNIGRTNIENVFIVQPRGQGLYLTHTYDVATVRNVEVWCNGPMQPGPAFRLGRNDELRMNNCFAFNCRVGYLFEDDAPAKGFEKDGPRSTYGTLTNCSTDACSIGYRVVGAASLNIVGGDFWNHHTGFELDHPQARVRIVNADLASNGMPAVWAKRAGSLILNGCRIRRAFANPDLVSTRFDQAAALTITNCQFGPFGPCIELGRDIGQAIIQANIFEPSPYVRVRSAAGEPIGPTATEPSKPDRPLRVLVIHNVGMEPSDSALAR